jgi:hypothetical protein
MKRVVCDEILRVLTQQAARSDRTLRDPLQSTRSNLRKFPRLWHFANHIDIKQTIVEAAAL